MIHSYIKKYLSSLILLSLLFFIFSSSAENTIPSITVSPVFHNNVNALSSCTSQITIAFEWINNTKTVQWMKNTQTIQWIKKTTEKIGSINSAELQELIKKYAWKERYKIGATAVIVVHAYLSGILIADYYFLINDARWSRWKPECTFADLCAMPQEQLSKELLIAINSRNVNQKNPTDMSHSLITFMNDIDKEIYRTERFVKKTKIIKALKMLKIFPTNDTKKERAQQLLERAHFIRHIFLSWLSQYNLTQKRRQVQRTLHLPLKLARQAQQ